MGKKWQKRTKIWLGYYEASVAAGEIATRDPASVAVRDPVSVAAGDPASVVAGDPASVAAGGPASVAARYRGKIFQEHKEASGAARVRGIWVDSCWLAQGLRRLACRLGVLSAGRRPGETNAATAENDGAYKQR